MNTYRRPSQEQYAYPNDSAPIATCYETTASPELSYHSSGSYNMMHPFSSYPSAMSSYYAPQTPLGGLPGGTVMHPGLGVLPTTRHEQQQPSFQDPRYLNTPRYMGAARSFMPPGDSVDFGVESQESVNEESMLSEPVTPPLTGFPNVEEFDDLMRSYVNDLSIKKQDKALINAKRARNIRTVLDNPKDTGIESAQFRFWVKKMFQLEHRTPDNRKFICHEGKPVAIREKLFKILTRAHQQCQHGGRDKTSTHVRQRYSWVPKELISRFVKICPTCQGRRGSIVAPTATQHLTVTPPDSRRSSPHLELARHQQSHIYGGPSSTSSSSGGGGGGRRKSTAYSYSDYHHHHQQQHGISWPETHHNYAHHSHPHHLVESSQASQYAASTTNSGFLATNANSRYSGY